MHVDNILWLDFAMLSLGIYEIFEGKDSNALFIILMVEKLSDMIALSKITFSCCDGGSCPLSAHVSFSFISFRSVSKPFSLIPITVSTVGISTTTGLTRLVLLNKHSAFKFVSINHSHKEWPQTSKSFCSKNVFLFCNLTT